MVKGILHGESDSRKTAFIEPEETIGLNNDVFNLENDERKEVQRILKALTGELSIYSTLLQTWYAIAGEYDFIRAKARLAVDYNGNYPNILDKAYIDLKDAYHPLLFFTIKIRQERPFQSVLRWMRKAGYWLSVARMQVAKQ